MKMAIMPSARPPWVLSEDDCRRLWVVCTHQHHHSSTYVVLPICVLMIDIELIRCSRWLKFDSR